MVVLASILLRSNGCPNLNSAINLLLLLLETSVGFVLQYVGVLNAPCVGCEECKVKLLYVGLFLLSECDFFLASS